MKPLFLIIGIVGIIAAAIVAFVFWDEAKTSQRLTVEAEAVGLTALPVEWEDDDQRVSGHTVTYAYTAGDEVIPKTLERITWYEDGKRYKVCYNPADPNDSKLYPAEHVCGQ